MPESDRWFLLVIHLDDVDKIADILEVFNENDVSGCTIFNTKGVGHSKFGSQDKPVIGSMKHLFGSEEEYNKTILSVIETRERLESTMQGVEEVVKDFCAPDIGLMYAMPLLHVSGYRVATGDGKFDCKT